jgi:hypothetical protein
LAGTWKARLKSPVVLAHRRARWADGPASRGLWHFRNGFISKTESRFRFVLGHAEG